MTIGNATNWTYVDFMREPTGGGILRAMGEPYFTAFGDFRFLFYVIIVGITMVMSYQRSHDVYAPLFVMMLAGSFMTVGLLGPEAAGIGTLVIAGTIAMILIRILWQRRL